MIDRGDIRQVIRSLQYIWASTAGRWLWLFEHKADSLIAKSGSGRNGQRDWCMSRVTAIISAYIRIIVCLSWAVNHYRDNAITYKAQRDKNARELKLANAAITDTCRCVSVMLLRSMQNTRLSMTLKRKTMPGDDVAAGRRRLHISSLSVSVREATSPPAWIMQPRLADTAERIISPLEVDHYAKTTGRNPEVY